jgi:K+-transporting ATPase c subunit
MKWNIRSKRFLALILYMGIWCAVGFVAQQWDTFGSMIYAVTGVVGGYILGESWRPSGSDDKTGQ